MYNGSRITKLVIQHYRSLAGVTLDVPNVMVLVGPNGSGKSNLVDAIRFLRDLTLHGLGHAVDQRGGIALVRQYSNTSPYHVAIEVEVEIPVQDEVQQFKYYLRFSGSDSSVRVEQESATYFKDPNRVFIRNLKSGSADKDIPPPRIGKTTFSRDRLGEVKVSGVESRFEIREDEALFGSRIFAPGFPHPTLLIRFFSRIQFASVYPNIMREPRRLETESNLKEDCSNWGSIIRRMRQRRQGIEFLDRALSLMKIAMPELKQITVKNVGGYVIPQFKIDSHKGSNYYLDPIQLSDGTLRLFGILLHLYQTPSASLLCIEEPEQTIHPGLLGVAVDAIREASKSMQVIVTTHSPYVLDHFDSDAIRVVTLKKGESRVSRIKQSQVEAVKNGLMMMSEIMSLDGLKPQEL